MLNEGNQIRNFISSSGSDFLTSSGSGSARQKVTVPTVPIPQHWICLHYKSPMPSVAKLNSTEGKFTVFTIKKQCCGTVTFYYGSGSGSGSDF